MQLKIKGAGYFNPANVSSSGLKRTTTPVPEGPLPMTPLEQAFKRDLIHVDPSDVPPYEMQSVHSTFAPVGGMTLEAALNDQRMFRHLTNAGMPANRPLAAYRYSDLNLDGKPMGVSISELPPGALAITPYDIYIAWYGEQLDPESLEFLKKYSSRNENFSISNPEHRLEVISTLGKVAGQAILDFSLKAGLYRFSGSPDNWNIQNDTTRPFFFSDVDTSRTLDSINAPQRAWETIRNLITAIHQWVYFFIPSLTYKESGYSPPMLQDNDFVMQLLTGFFPNASQEAIRSISSRIWKFLAPVFNDAKGCENVPLRGGEYVLQRHYPRPIFYLVLLNLLIDLIQNSELQKHFIESDTTITGISNYIGLSVEHVTHKQFFENYSSQRVFELIEQV
ncbi:hypothetical protein HYV57_04330 [Candidatus Peregrinibacteria bacterium]|nr:hypothetical protein [Candidatus Peregrinibacteria bacterium]